jgi:hypothetical protein
VRRLQSVKVWPRYDADSVRFTLVELLDAQGNTLLYKGNRDEVAEGMEPQIYSLKPGQKWIGNILALDEDNCVKEWTPLFMKY